MVNPRDIAEHVEEEKEDEEKDASHRSKLLSQSVTGP